MSTGCFIFFVCLTFLPLAISIVQAGDLPELKFEKHVLPNGLNVILLEDHSLPVVAVNVWYHVGSKNEKPGKTGFAHVFEHLMFQGSLHHNMLFEEGIKKIGGENNGSTSADRTNYWENVPSNYLEKILWLEADRMGNLLPAIDQKRLDIQRDVIKNERRESYDNQPYGRAYEMLLALLYPKDHPYSWPGIGSMEDLSAASIEDVSEFFRKYYAPNNASLCIAGDFDPALAKAWAEKYFGQIPSGPPIDRLKSWLPILTEVKRTEAEDNIVMPRLYMAWHTPAYYTPGDAEFDILASILSSGKSSRLYKTLVYDKQIAQDVNAYQESKELGSVFVIQVTAKKGQSLVDIEKEVDLILKDILTNGVTKDEFDRARTNWETRFVRSLQQFGGFGGRADRLNEYNVYLGDPGKLLWDKNRYSTASPESVKFYASQYINLNGRAILNINPKRIFTAGENTADMSAEPPAASEPGFKPPTIQKATFANGMTLMLVEKHDLPLVQFNLLFKSGWAADSANRAGVAALTAELLNEGTKSKNALQISDEAQRLGANLDAVSSWDNSTVVLNVLRKNFDSALKLMSEIVLEPTFPQTELDRQKKIRMGRIQQESKQPFTVAMKAYYRELYGADHPYGQPFTGSGTARSLEQITRADLVNFYNAHYLPNNATAIVVGDITLDEARTKLEGVFGKWKSGMVAASEIKQAKPIDKTRIYLIDKPLADQSAIIVGNLVMPRNDPDYLAMQVVTNILGGGATARLFMNLRQDKGYTYGSYSFANSRRGQGALGAYAEVQSAVTKEALAEFMKELRGIAGQKPISDSELVDSKNNLMKGYPQEFDTFGNIAGQLGIIVTNNLPENEWSTYMSRVEAVDAATAARIARNRIHPEAELIVIVGDKQKIEAGIKELNIGEIEYLDPAEL